MLHRYQLKDLTFRISEFGFHLWIPGFHLGSEGFHCICMYAALSFKHSLLCLIIDNKIGFALIFELGVPVLFLRWA